MTLLSELPSELLSELLSKLLSELLNLGFRTLTLSPLSPYISSPNLFGYKLGFCYDPSPSIWANDPNSALFFFGRFYMYSVGEIYPFLFFRAA